LTITMEGDWLSMTNTKFREKPDKPSDLRSSLRHSTVLSLSRAFGDSGLLLGLPADRRRP